MRITPEDIKSLKKDEVFVFGSNESGIHGAGAALVAFNEWGAALNKGFGFSGQTFAIPTKDWDIELLTLPTINFYVDRFISFARRNYSIRWKFLVTQIGCGLAGYTPEQIAPFFKECLDMKNVWLPQTFIDILKGKNEQEGSKVSDVLHND